MKSTTIDLSGCLMEYTQQLCFMRPNKTNLRFEDKLDGATNFLSWKVRVSFLLKELVIPQLLSPDLWSFMWLLFSYIMDLWYFIWLWNYAPSMINVIKDLWLLFVNVTLDFSTIVNVNVITNILATFECCYYWLRKKIGSTKEIKRVWEKMDQQTKG